MKIDLLDRPRLEVLNKRGLRYNVQDAEKDYFLAVILSIMYGSGLKDTLVFKGGTAIYHCYLEQLRFSKDLDFNARKKLKPSDVEGLFSGFETFKLKDIQEKKYGRIMEVRAGFHHASDMDLNKAINWKRMIEINGEYGCMGDLGMHTHHLPFRMGWIPETVFADPTVMELVLQVTDELRFSCNRPSEPFGGRAPALR